MKRFLHNDKNMPPILRWESQVWRIQALIIEVGSIIVVPHIVAKSVSQSVSQSVAELSSSFLKTL